MARISLFERLAIGITFTPTQLDAVVAVGMAIVGTIAISSADQTKWLAQFYKPLGRFLVS